MRLLTALPVAALVLLSTSGAEAKKRVKIAKIDPKKCGRSVGDWNPCFVPPNQIVYLSHKQLNALIAVDRAEKAFGSR